MRTKHKNFIVHRILLGSIFIFSVLNNSYCQNIFPVGTDNDSIYLSDWPPQPGEDSWSFIEDLKAPMWTHHSWAVVHPRAKYADLSGGVRLEAGFKDPKERLNTAYDDLRQFLAAGG